MFEKVREMLAKQLGIDPSLITAETKIMEDLGADSLDFVEMFMTIEQDYGLTIPDEMLSELKTVGDVVTYLEKNV